MKKGFCKRSTTNLSKKEISNYLEAIKNILEEIEKRMEEN